MLVLNLVKGLDIIVPLVQTLLVGVVAKQEHVSVTMRLAKGVGEGCRVSPVVFHVVTSHLGATLEEVLDTLLLLDLDQTI